MKITWGVAGCMWVNFSKKSLLNIRTDSSLLDTYLLAIVLPLCLVCLPHPGRGGSFHRSQYQVVAAPESPGAVVLFKPRELGCGLEQRRGRACRIADPTAQLGDDLGGNALALMGGDLTDVETALEICAERAGELLLGRTLMPRLDPDLRTILDQGTRFGSCPAHEPAGAEFPEEVACSWDA